MTFPPDIIFSGPDGTVYSEPALTHRFVFEKTCRIVLIHGFRNSQSEATESYEKFHAYFTTCGGYLSGKIFHLVWPGDNFSGNPLRYFDVNVQNALEAGRALGRYFKKLLDEEKTNCSFVIVAHSLGCRLTAAMMTELLRLDPQACRRFKLFLMAGAVPLEEVRDAHYFRDGLAASAYVANLYSPDDLVLKVWFRLGEVGGGRPISEPIGLKGGPEDFNWTEREHMKDFSHSDYWRRMSVARFIARALGMAVDNELPVNEPPSHSASENRLPGNSLS